MAEGRLLKKIFVLHVAVKCGRGESMTESEITISEWVKGQEEELAAYRAIGTAEEFKALKDDFWKLNEMCREYSAIGTVEELRELKEKAEPKKPYEHNFYEESHYYLCPECRNILSSNQNFCEECGTAIDWE